MCVEVIVCYIIVVVLRHCAEVPRYLSVNSPELIVHLILTLTLTTASVNSDELTDKNRYP